MIYKFKYNYYTWQQWNQHYSQLLGNTGTLQITINNQSVESL